MFWLRNKPLGVILTLLLTAPVLPANLSLGGVGHLWLHFGGDHPHANVDTRAHRIDHHDSIHPAGHHHDDHRHDDQQPRGHRDAWHHDAWHHDAWHHDAAPLEHPWSEDLDAVRARCFEDPGHSPCPATHADHDHDRPWILTSRSGTGKPLTWVARGNNDALDVTLLPTDAPHTLPRGPRTVSAAAPRFLAHCAFLI